MIFQGPSIPNQTNFKRYLSISINFVQVSMSKSFDFVIIRRMLTVLFHFHRTYLQGALFRYLNFNDIIKLWSNFNPFLFVSSEHERQSKCFQFIWIRRMLMDSLHFYQISKSFPLVSILSFFFNSDRISTSSDSERFYIQFIHLLT